jgi:cytochrome c-type biogenesis protein CcmH
VRRFALALALVLALAQPARAEDAPEEAVPGATVPLSPEQESQAIQIGKQLRCTVCQGLSIADSPATMARSMMQRVREMVRDGKPEPEIQQYFVDRYGEWVLLAPRARGFNWLVWVLPVAAVALGAYFVMRVLRRPGAATPAAPPPAPASEDPYVAAVRKDLDT